MARQLLVIDGEVKGYFFLSFEGQTATIAIDPTHPDMTLHKLRVARIRVEFEVADEHVLVSHDSPADSELVEEYDLFTGQTLDIGRAHFSLAAAGASLYEEQAPAVAEEPEAAPVPAAPAADAGWLDAASLTTAAPVAGTSANADSVSAGSTLKELVVTDGADQGRSYTLPPGAIAIGKSHKHADICLNDLYVGRVHCEMQVEGDQVFVVPVDAQSGTFVNGQRIAERQQMRGGDMLRVGNTHLRLDMASTGTAPMPAAPKAEPEEAEAQDEVEAAAAAPSNALKQLLVIDGADQGRSYTLPPGTICIGKSHKHADICLNDLYVARVHCELQVEGGQVYVVPVDAQSGTLVNGQRISERRPLKLGDVVRVGNSHLRLEIAPADATVGPAKPADSEADLPVALDCEEASNPAVEVASPITPVLDLEEQVLGHYRIGTILGLSESSVVFRAHDTKSEHMVALKVLAPEFPRNDTELQGFVRALKVVPNLKHAHLVMLQAAGKAGRFCWVARELVEGENLDELITRLSDEGKLGWKRACRVAMHLGEALAFLAQHKIVHGNITPWNILVCTDTKNTKLDDLMFDAALRGSQLHKTMHDKKQLAVLPYQAVERIEGRADQRSDLYALGAALYHLITGQPPFDGPSVKELTTQVREAKIVEPSKFQKDMPAALEAAVLKLLARRPQDRYQSAAELLADIEPIVAMHDIKV